MLRRLSFNLSSLRGVSISAVYNSSELSDSASHSADLHLWSSVPRMMIGSPGKIPLSAITGPRGCPDMDAVTITAGRTRPLGADRRQWSTYCKSKSHNPINRSNSELKKRQILSKEGGAPQSVCPGEGCDLRSLTAIYDVGRSEPMDCFVQRLDKKSVFSMLKILQAGTIRVCQSIIAT